MRARGGPPFHDGTYVLIRESADERAGERTAAKKPAWAWLDFWVGFFITVGALIDLCTGACFVGYTRRSLVVLQGYTEESLTAELASYAWGYGFGSIKSGVAGLLIVSYRVWAYIRCADFLGLNLQAVLLLDVIFHSVPVGLVAPFGRELVPLESIMCVRLGVSVLALVLSLFAYPETFRSFWTVS